MVESKDFCVPIYLNQQIVFDLLAILEDGFSTLSSIKTSTAEIEKEKSGIGASFGLSNVFALLNVSLKGDRSKEAGSDDRSESSYEKVHTPTSLFARLRQGINSDDKKLLKLIRTNDDIEELKCGDFIEFRAILRKNPLVDLIETIKQISEIAILFEDEKAGSKSKTSSGKSNQLLLSKFDKLLSSLTVSNSIEIIAEMLDSPGEKAVLSAKVNYFTDQNPAEIIDGEFQVMGKVIRIVKPDSEDSINLLRKTSFGRLDAKVFEKLKKVAMNSSDSGIIMPEVVTEIDGPALQVIPIAIFT